MTDSPFATPSGLGIATLGIVSLLLGGCGNQEARNVPEGPAATAAPIELVEEAGERGLVFTHRYGTSSPMTIVESMGSGCAFLDFDDDGNLDVFLVSSGNDFEKLPQPSGSRLFRNTGGGRFADVTPQSGIVYDRYGMGCCVGDYDGDGKDDLFVTGYGGNRLFRNLGSGKFADVTTEAGIVNPPGVWGTGCAFLDVNKDGRLDLYVANYVRYDPKIPHCKSGNVMSGCSPNQYRTQPNQLYLNLGKGKFAERAKALGAVDASGASLGVLTCDFDEDGKTDVLVANDGTPNALFHNLGNGFRDVADAAGVAFASSGRMLAGMGTDAADFDGDGRLDFIITNYQFEPNSLYRNQGNMIFVEQAQPAGIGAASMPRLKFGVAFVDLDRDGHQDLYSGSGHVLDNIAEFEKGSSFEQIDQVFRHMGDGRFVELPAGSAFPEEPSVTRGVAIGDIDNDGSPEVLTNNLGRPTRLLVNRAPSGNHWLGVKLEGDLPNARAIGARIELVTKEGVQVREIRSGGSYLSQSDFRQLFGLGSKVNVNDLTVSVRWPSGNQTKLRPQRINTYLTITESKERSRGQ